eukprot:tig00000889_g5336.t1
MFLFECGGCGAAAAAPEDPASCSPASPLSLPSDLIVSVLELLGAVDLFRAGQVCREFRSAAQNPRLWRTARVSSKLPQDLYRANVATLQISSLVPLCVLQRAASWRNREALWLLGRMHLIGSPMMALLPDEAHGMSLLLEAAQMGHAQAQYELALAHARRGDDRSYIYWTQRAANQGHSLAQIALGLAFACGRRGLPQDLAAFQKWRLLSGCTQEYHVNPNMTEEQAREGARQAALWRPAVELERED